MDVKQLSELTVRDLVNYGLGHSPTMAEKIENDSSEGWCDWTEHRQLVAERREVMLEGAV